jgi:hypothetical protein
VTAVSQRWDAITGGQQMGVFAGPGHPHRGVAVAAVITARARVGHGWVYAIGIATAGAAMAVSIPLRNALLLALGALAMFGHLADGGACCHQATLSPPLTG